MNMLSFYVTFYMYEHLRKNGILITKLKILGIVTEASRVGSAPS